MAFIVTGHEAVCEPQLIWEGNANHITESTIQAYSGFTMRTGHYMGEIVPVDSSWDSHAYLALRSADLAQQKCVYGDGHLYHWAESWAYLVWRNATRDFTGVYCATDGRANGYRNLKRIFFMGDVT